MEPDLCTDDGFVKDYNVYVDMIYHICVALMKNKYDAEDMLQETFVKLLKRESKFDCEEHKKAWLIVTATNLCKDNLKHWWKKQVPFEENEQYFADSTIDLTFMAVMDLPYKYCIVIYLNYYQGYNSSEIAQMFNKPCSTIRSNLSKAKNILLEHLIDSMMLRGQKKETG